MVFISKRKYFYKDYGTQAKIQIDNSLDLGWRREDIILATNFKFKYNGVKSILVSDDNFVPYCQVNSKFKAIEELFNRGIISGKELYWFHDLDASQTEAITESEISIGEADLAMTDNAWMGRWHTGSFFFTPKSKDIIKSMIATQDLLMVGDELSLTLHTIKFTEEDKERLKNSYDSSTLSKIPKINNIDKRIKKINISYNFVPVVDIRSSYNAADKPIKVIHFRIYGSYFPNIPSLLDFYMYGKNDINTVLMPKRLIKIYQHHGVK